MGEAILLKMRGGGNRNPPERWRFLQAISANSSFTMEAGKWYRVHVYGRSGNGGQSQTTTKDWSSDAPGAGGGGSGGYACSILMEKNGATVPCTVSASITSFGAYLSATAGADGGSAVSKQNVGGVGGAGGQGSGGNQINNAGFSGGNGGAARGANSGARGGNLGGNGGAFYNHSENGPGMTYSAGGGGGARLPDSPYTGVMGAIGAGGNGTTFYFWDNDSNKWDHVSANPGNTPPAWNSTQPPILYGGGGGGGGFPHNAYKYTALGGAGTPGLIIIEVGDV